MSRLHPRKFACQPHMRCVPIITDGIQEAIVIKNLVFADIAMKAMYVSLAIAAFVFISMLLLTGLH
jgi:hypothetical protein